MGFSAIIPAADASEANAVLETAGFGPDNFSVPLMRGDNPAIDSYGLNSSSQSQAFYEACSAIANVSVMTAPPGMVMFDEHVEAEGLSRT
jgi:hypothetical protein